MIYTMHNLKIHWRGYPHRRFPRIRSPSRSLTSSNHSLAHAAAKNALRQPLGKALCQERLKTRFRIGRRRLRSSRSSSSVVRARKRATVRARQHIQVFGWKTPQADAASTTSKFTPPARSLEPTSTKPSVSPPPGSSPEHTVTQSTAIDSNDTGAVSLVRHLKSNAPSNPYSLMHVAEVPFYWKSTKAYHQTRPSDQFITSPAGPSGKEYAHVGPLDTVSRRSSPYPYSSQHIRRSGTYDHRIDPKNRVNVEGQVKSATAPAKISINTQRSKVKKKASEASFNPTFRRAVQSYTSKSKENRASVQSLRSVIQTILSSRSFRSSSQKRALKHFTKELELYIQATRSLPKNSLIASTSATTVSANTVEDLMPFQAEFRAAGLAVTSEEQRRKSFIMPGIKKSIAPPETPPKDDRWKSNVTGPPNHHHRKTSSIPSFSSGTTVMGWTPPHEATLRQGQQKSHRTSYTMSSDHTVMAFTPPHEQAASQKQPLLTASKSPARKSLPWLRQPETTPRSPPSPTTRIEARSSTKLAKSDTPLLEDALTSLIMNIPSISQEYMEEPVVSQRLRRRSEVRWNDTTYVVQDKPGSRSHMKVERYADASTQVDNEFLKKDDTPEVRCCANAVTQTEMITVGSASVEVPDIGPRAPMTSGRGNIFSMKASRCTSNCNQETVKTPKTRPPPKTPPKSQCVEQATQKDTTPDSLKIGRSVIIVETSSFEPKVKVGDRMQMFACTSSPRGGSTPYRPFQASMAFRSPQKNGGPLNKSPERSMVSSPTREAPLPPMQSSGLPGPEPTIVPRKTEEVMSDPDVQATSLSRYIEAETRLPSSEPEPMPEMISVLDPSSGILHQCTERFLEYKQCSPQEEGPSVPPPSGRYIAQEQSTKPCMYEVGGTVDTEKCCPTSVERCMPDPVKRPPVSKLQLRQTHQAHLHSKQSHVKCSSPLPPIPIILEPCPLPESGANSDTCSLTETPRPGGITDKQVFRGLHVATAAACDEDVDKWIEEIMGSGVRRFLADLSAFDGLGINSSSTVARKAATQRRDQVRAWERTREQRMEQRADECKGKRDIEARQGRSMDRKIGLSAGDESVTLRSLREGDRREARE